MEDKGVLKVNVIIGGVTYKKGEEASFPEQYGLKDCFENQKEIKDPTDGKERK